MSGKPFTVTKEQARELKRRADKASRNGGVPHEVVLREWRADMATELKKLTKTYERTGRGAKELLEGLVIAEANGVDAALLVKIRLKLADQVSKRRAA